ncbi:response regulator transcription factor [Hahella aquimaris]|uniref:response regulator n=1 Tax=Hahella sp. HNIBRBA332 TaxID=3015983 RepID=UPI00273B96B2|nr:response regulator transcription factor [Hahella sp. HNIBRBA332]WLQ13487.1 response regulator transcription factor [Hahella sp. HNIBRBA332]
MRILLVEDDELLADGIQTSLTQQANTVDWVASGEAALHALKLEQFHLVILDLGLPDIDGFTVLKRLRDRGDEIPVLILSARDQVQDRVKGLDAGADDYLLKPFDVSELKARLRALSRRGSGNAHPEIQLANIRILPSSYQVYKNNEEVRLSRREYALLYELASHRGRVLSKDQLEELVYGWSDDVSSNTMEVHIHNLRKKLNADLIKTVRGMGYMIEKE